MPAALRDADDARGGARPPRLGRGAPHERLRLVPPLPARERRAQAAATSSASSGRTRPYTALLDDYEPGMTDDRGARRSSRLRPALTELVAHAPEVDASFLTGDFPPEAQRELRRAGDRDTRLRRTAPGGSTATAHPFCTSFSNRDVRLTTRYQRERPRVGLVDAARGRARALRARHRRLAATRTPLARRAVAGRERVAEPDLGEPRRPQPPVLDALVRAAAGDVPAGARRGRRSTTSSARSTAPSRA